MQHIAARCKLVGPAAGGGPEPSDSTLRIPSESLGP